ncbi:hypothetical protein TRFO_10524 [Tritrichomonas foetus]|uniref:VWFA domain-containing protein n=1 Tax=Tritrichomonas foetus TaxID=1144522 RepID=A0A1J4J885_9EUKA|nr:hypothetical protein TRFO_10524 [Tritrichomonas foetus]|eukprot:OHS95390.1 hypothetical protein TRFO_10524 [Tritrichomonas foetus]
MDVLFMIDATGSMASTIQAAHDKAEDLAFDLQINNRTADFQFGCICYRDPVDSKADVHQYFNFDPDIENLANFLEDVKASGGGDGPEDYVGALDIAFNNLNWRDGKKAIIWIADAPAHGKQFCGTPNHQEEEPKLVPLVQRLGAEKFYMVGISLNGGADLTFSEMKRLYEDAGGQSFRVESFTPEKGEEIARIADTMATTTKDCVSDALGDF